MPGTRHDGVRSNGMCNARCKTPNNFSFIAYPWIDLSCPTAETCYQFLLSNVHSARRIIILAANIIFHCADKFIQLCKVKKIMVRHLTQHGSQFAEHRWLETCEGGKPSFTYLWRLSLWHYQCRSDICCTQADNKTILDIIYINTILSGVPNKHIYTEWVQIIN